MDRTSISKPQHVVKDGWHVSTASVSIGDETYRVQFRASAGPINRGPDPFLAAALLPAMKVGLPLKLQGTVSPKLFAASQTIQDIFQKWFPKEFQKIPLEALAEMPDEAGSGNEVGAFFSGGVDSFYTLLKHQDEITKIILIHGFNQYYSTVLRDKVTQEIRHIAKEFGKTLVEVETDVRQLSDKYADYTDHYVGSMLAAAGLLLSPQFRKIYVPATNSYEYWVPEGTHPLLDPMWSTESLTFDHDGCEAYRVDKIARIAQSDIALRSLRVCFSSKDNYRNCGVCEKCIRTMVALKAAGALERCTAFNEELDTEAVSRLRIRHTGKIPYMIENLKAIERRGDAPELAVALRSCIKNHEHDQLSAYLNENLNDFLASTQGVDFVRGSKNTLFRSLWENDPGFLLKEAFKEYMKDIDKNYLYGVLRRIFAPAGVSSRAGR